MQKTGPDLLASFKITDESLDPLISIFLRYIHGMLSR